MGNGCGGGEGIDCFCFISGCLFRGKEKGLLAGSFV